ncbi:MAG: tetratricopeptide repeat protein [Labilithrix sp.]|nr:tetratricopeptide repeat protein [Labilithrix sp.]
MRRVRVGLLASSCVAVAFFTAVSASAQPKGAPAGPPRSNGPMNLRRGAAGGADAEAARGRARARDCAGALVSFDAAIRVNLDPSLRRDRGLCHETLGHPFPAIDDYRAYLAVQPDAADADQIRQRLAALEEQTGTGGPSAQSMRERDREPAGTGGEVGASVSIGSGGASASSSSSSSSSSESDSTDGAKSAAPARSYDYYVAQEKLADAAESSPLRYGSGIVLGPFVNLPRFFFGEGSRQALAYGVGATFRYSTGPTVTLVSEIGYAGIGTSGAASSQSGPLLMGGVELRLPVSRYASDHILLRGGLGYERYVASGTRSVNDNVLGRFAVGFRHVFGPSLGLELLVDGGPAYIIPESAPSRLNVAVGASVGFVVGF